MTYETIKSVEMEVQVGNDCWFYTALMWIEKRPNGFSLRGRIDDVVYVNNLRCAVKQVKNICHQSRILPDAETAISLFEKNVEKFTKQGYRITS